LKFGLTDCPETLVTNYRSTLHKIPVENRTVEITDLLVEDYLHWEDLGVDGWIILGWISRRWDVGIWTGVGWPRIETGSGSL